MASVQIGAVEQHRVYRVEDGIYLVRLAGHLSVAASTQLTQIVRLDNPTGPRAVIYETTNEFTGYDSELRGGGGRNIMLEGTVHIGIVTPSALLRMVGATIAIGLRPFGIPMATHANVDLALAAARNVLDKARSRSR